MKQEMCRAIGTRRERAAHLVGLGWVCVLMAATWAGCQPEAKVDGAAASAQATTAETTVVGLYRLVEVDGREVPCVVEHHGHSMTIAAGSFRIEADGTCSSRMELTGHEQAIERRATYTRTGAELTMKWKGFGTTRGAVEGDTFRMNNEGMVLTYRK